MFAKILRRPVLAYVLSIFLVILGGISIATRPVSQFPNIAPPQVQIFLAFPGASADVLVRSTIIPLEQSINGVPGMRYMLSDATSAGEGTITVVFDQGVDPNDALVQVKTRVDRAMNRLPPLVQLEGVILMPIVPSMLMYINIYSDDDSADEKFLYNYAGVNILPEIQRVKGVARAKILGSRTYAMRIWVDPDRMRAYDIGIEDVMDAIAEQSVIGRPGRIGRSSGKRAQALEYVLIYPGRYNDPEEYENIVLRATPDGHVLRLGDIARVELGSEFFDIYSNLDGRPSASMVLKQVVGSNAREVIARVKEKLAELEREFPPGMKYSFSYDVSAFLDASINQVEHTLFEAFVLVALVVLVFLGDVRSTIIPTIAVPVSLVGAWIFGAAFGVSVNLISLFALVLAIGVVVDDAIVVVEAVHAKMEAEHLSPFHAVRGVLGEITSAVVAITLVMASVFVPITFLPGPVGVFYREFGLTMATSIVLSGLVALTLTPVLCATFLRRHHGHALGGSRNPWVLFLGLFNRTFNRVTDAYAGVLRRTAGRPLVTLAILGAFVAGIVVVERDLPAGFVPSEDQGIIYAIIQTPPGSTLERTNEVARRLQEVASEIEAVHSVTSLAGYEIMTEGRGSNAGTCLINLKPWEEREASVHEVIEELEEKTKDFGAIIEYFEPPAVPGYGSAGGIALRLIDKSPSPDYQEFDRVTREFMAALDARPEITGLFTFYAANYPQFELKFDPKLAMQKGVSMAKALETLAILVGSTYEQGFIKFGRFFKVYVQAAPEFRALPTDILRLYVKNEEGEMVPLSSFMRMERTNGPNELTRYNIYNSAAIRGVPAPGYTTGDAIRAIREIAEDLPHGYDIAWEGLSYDEARRGNEAIIIFGAVVLFVYLILSAQYESFVLPLAVLFSLPPGIFGAMGLLRLLGLANDVYAQLAFVMLVGMLGKNAILIVEFAEQRRRRGMPVLDAAIEGARARFRPILMTSFAFIAGLVPLVRATGAGAIGNRTIGGSALGGMLVGTVIGVFVIPGLYYIFANIAARESYIREDDEAPQRTRPDSAASAAADDTVARAEEATESGAPPAEDHGSDGPDAAQEEEQP